MDYSLGESTLAQLRAISADLEVRKDYTQPAVPTAPAGLQMILLEGPSRRLFPVITPFRNRIARRAAPQGATALFWKETTGINTSKVTPGVSEGNRNAVISQTYNDRLAKFAGLGMENVNTFEAKYSSRGYADVQALARLDALQALMIAEERVIVGGNNSLALGIPATPTGTLKAGGTMTAQANVCYVVALTAEGMYLSSVSGGVATTTVRTNADGSSDTIKCGSSNKSLESAAVTTVGGNLSVEWKCTAVRGAHGYAWFVGLTGAANCKLAAITTTNLFLQLADAAGTQVATAISADNSKNALEFDGITTLLETSGSGAYYKSLNGAALTVDTAGGIPEFDAVLFDRWDTWKTQTDAIFVPAKQMVKISQLVLSSGASPLFRIYIDNSKAGQGSIMAGGRVGSYLDKVTNREIPLILSPTLPDSKIVFWADSLPWPVQDAPTNSWEIMTRQEYYAINWPYRSRRDETGIYVDEGLVDYFPFANGILSDVG